MVFTPSGIEAAAAPGTTVLDTARAAGVDIDSVCGGRGLCGRCQVVPGTGHFAKWGLTSTADALTAPGTTEREYRGRRPLGMGHRLGCQAGVLADVVIDVPAQSQVHRPVVRKAIDLGAITVDPVVSLHYVVLPPAALGDESSDAERLTDALADQWGLAAVEVPAGALPGLSAAVAAGSGAVTAVVHSRRRDHGPGDASPPVERRVLTVRPGYVDEAYGVAVDVGSTTVAGYLLNLASGEVVATAGRMNPQIRFGEDLMSRVSYAMLNPGGTAELTQAVREAIDELVDELSHAAKVDRAAVCELVVVGNPIMHHLVLGIDPTPLGAAPFTLAVRDGVWADARDIGLDLPGAALYVGPCIAGHVGADAVAALLAEGPHRSSRPMLVVDVGTNAEILLGDGTRVWAASSPTGPAFEGAQISGGQRATAGAIERVRIDPDTLEPRYKVIGSERWSDDPGFAGSLSSLEISGLCGSGIIEVIAEMFLAGIIDHRGVIRGELAARSPRIVADGRTFAYVLQTEPVPLSVTQNDVRAVQLAKAALRAGIDLLMTHAGITEPAEVRLAGAFGAHISPVHAMVLGLVPDGPVDGVTGVGNASGAGAARMLVSGSQRAEAEHAARSVVKIETATEARFQELFVAAMALPHEAAATTHLERVVDLPPRPPAGTHQAGTRRTRPHRDRRTRQEQP
ncbi:ASKHA domain-containing protein [Candidatus Poriferisocius sp.]|uniref:ASKHA domain-containing protein n=1 Tax=Candidatus Poriferisocius sp. TaxID=3101276 RepID=UPI003B591689